MRTMIFGAGTDLGVHIDGADLGPVQLMNDLKSFYKGESMLLSKDKSIIKSRNLSDRRKNEYEIEKFNSLLYKTMIDKIKEEYFPIMVGGDSSATIASTLADTKVNIDVGIIWISANPGYDTFESTVTGNIHGLPLAALDGYEKRYLTDFHSGNFFKPENTAIVGGRDIDPLEIENLKDAGVRVFTTDEVHERGMAAVMEDAIAIATNGTQGMHISYDLDVIDPKICPGVSVPAVNGINLDEAYEAVDSIIKHKAELKSLDIVEYNPERDIDNKTGMIAKTILESIINNI